MTVLRECADLHGKQVFYCTNNCRISLCICTVIWTVFAVVGHLFSCWARVRSQLRPIFGPYREGGGAQARFPNRDINHILWKRCLLPRINIARINTREVNSVSSLSPLPRINIARINTREVNSVSSLSHFRKLALL